MSPDIDEAPIPLMIISSTLYRCGISAVSNISFDFLICSGKLATKSSMLDLSISFIVFMSSSIIILQSYRLFSFFLKIFS